MEIVNVVWVKVYTVKRFYTYKPESTSPIIFTTGNTITSIHHSILSSYNWKNKLQKDPEILYFVDKDLALQQKDLWQNNTVQNWEHDVIISEDVGFTRDSGISVNLIGPINHHNVTKDVVTRRDQQ